jgi:hypothetical protein
LNLCSLKLLGSAPGAAALLLAIAEQAQRRPLSIARNTVFAVPPTVLDANAKLIGA